MCACNLSSYSMAARAEAGAEVRAEAGAEARALQQRAGLAAWAATLHLPGTERLHQASTRCLCVPGATARGTHPPSVHA